MNIFSQLFSSLHTVLSDFLESVLDQLSLKSVELELVVLLLVAPTVVLCFLLFAKKKLIHLEIDHDEFYLSLKYTRFRVLKIYRVADTTVRIIRCTTWVRSVELIIFINKN